MMCNLDKSAKMAAIGSKKVDTPYWWVLSQKPGNKKYEI